MYGRYTVLWDRSVRHSVGRLSLWGPRHHRPQLGPLDELWGWVRPYVRHMRKIAGLLKAPPLNKDTHTSEAQLAVWSALRAAPCQR